MFYKDRKIWGRFDERGGKSENEQPLCFVCKKLDCRSTKHSTAEQIETFRKKTVRAFVAEILAPARDTDDNESASDEGLCHEIEVYPLENKIDMSNIESSLYFSKVGKILDDIYTATFMADIARTEAFHAVIANLPK